MRYLPTRLTFLIIFTFSAFVCPLSARAVAPPDVADDIQSVLSTLRKSDCQFMRNGTWYSANDAAAHLQKKFDYLNARNLADTVALFIERAGTQSSMSGKAYAVRCPGQPEMSSAEWLKKTWQTLPR